MGLFSDLYPGFILDSFTTNFPEVNRFSIAPGGAGFPIAPTEVGNAASVVTGCNAGFVSNFNSGGTVGSYLNNNPLCTGAVPNLNDVSQNTKNPTYVEWNLEMQHALGNSTTFSMNYVGNHGYDLFVNNPAVNGFGFGGLQTRPPDSRVLQTSQFYNPGVSNYNGLTASLSQRVWHGFTGSFSYTWSHAADDVSNGGFAALQSLQQHRQFVYRPILLSALLNMAPRTTIRGTTSTATMSGAAVQVQQQHYERVCRRLDGLGELLLPHRIAVQRVRHKTSSDLTANNLGTATILAYQSGAGPLPPTAAGRRSAMAQSCLAFAEPVPAGRKRTWV